MSSSSGTIAARRQRPLSRRSLALELAANQPSTSRSAEREISTTTGWGLLKQPDNQNVTSDGNGFPDSAWSELYTAANVPVALLFSAQTTASGNTVPGYTVTGGPSVDATLTPASVDLGTQGGPVWSKLGAFSGSC